MRIINGSGVWVGRDEVRRVEVGMNLAFDFHVPCTK